MKIFIICFALIALVYGQSWPNVYQQRMPYFNHPCRRSDPYVEQCILRKIEQLRPSLRHLIEPLIVDRIEIDTSISGAKMKATLTNFIARQGSNFHIQDLKVNLDNRYQYIGEATVVFPAVFIAANYHFKGTKYLLMDFETNGQYRTILNNLAIVFNWVASTYVRYDGVEIINVDSVTARMSFGDVKLKLFQADDSWAGSEIVSYAESDPAGSLRKLTPAIEEKTAQLFKDYCNNILTRVPLHNFLVD